MFSSSHLLDGCPRGGLGAFEKNSGTSQTSSATCSVSPIFRARAARNSQSFKNNEASDGGVNIKPEAFLTKVHRCRYVQSKTVLLKAGPVTPLKRLWFCAIVVIAAAVAVSASAFASNRSGNTVDVAGHNIDMLVSLGGQLKKVISDDTGFPRTYLKPWNKAVDLAFDRQLLEADLRKASSKFLSDEARQAALTFASSPLGQKLAELSLSSSAHQPGSAALADARAFVESASAPENARFVDLFEKQFLGKRAHATMDMYYRAMRVAAVPVVGAEVANEWVVSAQALRAGYVEDYFLGAVRVYRQFSNLEIRDLVRTYATAEMTEYTRWETQIVSEVMQSAVERLEAAYAKQLNGR